MSWTADSGNIYKLCLLDTNAISEILKNPQVEGRKFITRFSPDKYVPCITIYNIIEIRRNKDIYEKFLDFFSRYPFFLLKPFQYLLEEELKNYEKNQNNVSALFNSFTPLEKKDTYQLKTFISKIFKVKEIKRAEKNWRNEEKETINSWLSYKNNFKPSNPNANAKDAEKYIKEAGSETLIRLKPNWVKNNIIDNNKNINYNKLPSFKVMLYSQYYRLYDSHWEPNPQEVTDVTIMAAAPYVDAIITEKFQASIFEKIKKRVPKLESLDIYKIKHIRN